MRGKMARQGQYPIDVAEDTEHNFATDLGGGGMVTFHFESVIQSLRKKDTCIVRIKFQIFGPSAYFIL